MSAAIPLSPFEKIPTPCIGVCSTALGDSVCRGCKRFNHEVIHWNSFNEEQKRLIDARLQEFLQRVSKEYIVVSDEAVLAEKIQWLKIRVAKHRGPYTQAFELLRAGGEQVKPFANYGLQVRAPYDHWTVAKLRESIDRDFWQLSSAHFERYFP